MSTTDRSGVNRNRLGVWVPASADGTVTVMVSTPRGSTSKSTLKPSIRLDADRAEVPGCDRGRGHGRPSGPQRRCPSAFDLREHRVDGAGRLIAPQHPTEQIALLFDDAHPDAKRTLPERRDAVDPSLVAGGGDLRTRLHQAVLLELREGAVDGRSIDPPEVELAQILLEAVAVACLLGQEQQDGGKHEPAGRGELEPRRERGFRSSRRCLLHRSVPYVTTRIGAIGANRTDLHGHRCGVGNWRCARCEGW